MTYKEPRESGNRAIHKSGEAAVFLTPPTTSTLVKSTKTLHLTTENEQETSLFK
jgi:hypothetical protein